MTVLRQRVHVYRVGFVNYEDIGSKPVLERRFHNNRIRMLLYAGRPNWDLLATISLKYDEPTNLLDDLDESLTCEATRRRVLVDRARAVSDNPVVSVPSD